MSRRGLSTSASRGGESDTTKRTPPVPAPVQEPPKGIPRPGIPGERVEPVVPTTKPLPNPAPTPGKKKG